MPSVDYQIDFFRFYISVLKGRITKNIKAILDICLSSAEFFFAGFIAAIGTATLEEGRQEIYKVCIQYLSDLT